MAYMPRLLAAFKAQSAKKGYEFMKTHLPASGTAYVAGADEKWIESSKELIAGTIGADYFKDGNTVMTGVDYTYPPGPSLKHWVVVVKEPEKEKVAGIDRFLYPADDPLFGQVYVMAPLLGKVSDKTLDDAHLSKTGIFPFLQGPSGPHVLQGPGLSAQGENHALSLGLKLRHQGPLQARVDQVGWFK